MIPGMSEPLNTLPPLAPAEAADLSVARGHKQAIEAARRQATNSLLRQARHLSLGRRLLRGEPAFSAWLQSLSIRPGIAELLLRVDALFGAAENSDQAEAGALLLLAGPDVPPAAVSHAGYLARRGEQITTDIARQIIARFSPPSAESAEPIT